MSTTVDNKVVQMTLDKDQFETATKDVLASLDSLKKSLDKTAESASSFDKLSESIQKINLDGLTNAVTGFQNKVTSVGKYIKEKIVKDLTGDIVAMGKKFVASVSVDQIKAGFKKYEDYTSSVQTILAAVKDTGQTLEDVEGYLGRLNKFTDETSYNLTDMTNNIGKFTSQRIPLEQAVVAMEGIATASALSGGKIQDASHAMEGFSKAMGRGYMDLINWRWVETAKLSTAGFKQTLMDVAEAEGELVRVNGELMTANKKARVSVEEFNYTLSEKWLTKDVMIKALEQYGSFADKITQLSTMTEVTVTELLGMIDDYRDLGDKFNIGKAAETLGVSVEEAQQILDKLTSEEYKLGEQAFRASQEAKTFSEAIDSVKDAVSTGWMTTFKYIFGNYEQAKKLWTKLSEDLYAVFAEGSEARNKLFKAWNEKGGYDTLVEALSLIGDAIVNINYSVRDAISAIFPPMSVETMLGLSEAFKMVVGYLTPTEEGLLGIQKVLEGILRPIKAVINVVKTAASYLGAFVFVIASSLGALFEWIGRTEEFENPLKTLFGEERYLRLAESVRKILDGLRNTFDRLIAAASALFSVLRDSGILESVFGSIGRLLGGFKEKALDAIVWLFDKISSFTLPDDFLNLGSVTTFFKNGLSALSPIIQTVYGHLSNLFNIVKNFFSTFDFSKLQISLPNIGKALGDVGGKLQEFGTYANSLFQNKEFRTAHLSFGFITDAVKNFGTAFKQMLTSVDISGVGRDILDFLKDFVSFAADMAKGLAKDAAGGVKVLGDAIHNALSVAKTNTTGAFGGIVKFFTGIKNAVTSFPGKVLDFVAKGIQGIGNALKNFTGGIANGVINFFAQFAPYVDAAANKFNAFMVYAQPFFDFMKKFIGTVTPSHIAIAILAVTVIKFMNAFASAAKGIGSVGKSLTEGIKKVSESFAETGKKVNTILDGFKDIGTKTGKTIDTFNKSIEDLTNAAKKKMRGGFLEFIGQISRAMLLLSISLAILAKQDQGSLQKSAIILGVLTTVLIGLSAFAANVAKKMNDADMAKVTVLLGSLTRAMRAFAASLLLMAVALRITKEIPVVDLLERVGVFAALGLALAGIATIVGKLSPKLALSSLGFLVFATTLSIAMGMIMTVSKIFGKGVLQGIVDGARAIVEVIKDTFKSMVNFAKAEKGNVNYILLGLLSIVTVATSVMFFADGMSKLLAKMSIRIAAGFLAFAGAIKVFQIVISSMSDIKTTDILKGIGNMAIIAVFMGALELFFIGLNWLTKGQFGSAISGVIKLGVAVNLFALAMIPLTGAVFLLSRFKPEELEKARDFMLAVSVMMGTMMLISQYAKGGQMVLAAAAMAILTGIMYALVGLIAIIKFIDIRTLIKGGAVVAVLASIFGALMFVSQFATKSVGVVAAMGAIIIGLVTAVALLSAINIKELWSAAGAVTLVMASFAAVLYASSKIDKMGIVAIAAAAVALGGLAAAFAFLPSLSDQVPGILALAGAMLAIAIAIRILAPVANALPKVGLMFLEFSGAVALFAGGIALFMWTLSQIQNSSPEFFNGIITLAQAVVTFIGSAVTGIIELVGTLLIKIVDAIIINGPILIEGIVQIITLITQTITETLPMILETIWGIISGILNMIITGAPLFFQAGFAILMALLNGIRDNIEQIVMVSFEILLNLLNGLTNAINEHGEDILEAGAKLIGAIVDAIVKSFFKLVDCGKDAVKEFISGIKSKDTAEDMTGAGESVLEGFIEGLESVPLLGGIVTAGKNAFGKARQGVEEAGQIESPSKVMKWLGEMTGLGFINGMADKLEDIEKTGEQMGHAAVAGIDKVVSNSPFGGLFNNLFGNLTDKYDSFMNKKNQKPTTSKGGGGGGGSSKKEKKPVEVQIKTIGKLIDTYKVEENSVKTLVEVYRKSLIKEVGPGVKKVEIDNAKASLAAAKAIDTFSVSLYEAKDPANKLEYQQKTLAEAIALIKGETKEASDAAKELAKSVTEGATKEQQIAEVTAKVIEDRLKGVREAWNDYKKSVTDAISSSLGLFDKLDNKTEMSMDSLIENSNDWLEYYDSWKAGIYDLIDLNDNGIPSLSQRFLQYLIDQGVNSKPMVDTILRASEEEREQLLENFERRMDIVSGAEDSGIAEKMAMRFGGYAEALSDVVVKGEEEVLKVTDNLGVDVLATLGNHLNTDEGYKPGSQLTYGIAAGISDPEAVEAVRASVRYVAREAMDEFTEETDENSPSKVFATFGKFLDLGLAKGVTDYANEPVNAVGRLANTINAIGSYINGTFEFDPVIRPTLDLTNVAEGARGISRMFNQNRGINVLEDEDALNNSKSGASYTFIQNNNSPKALSRIDIYRQTKNQFAYFKEVAGGI